MTTTKCLTKAQQAKLDRLQQRRKAVEAEISKLMDIFETNYLAQIKMAQK